MRRRAPDRRSWPGGGEGALGSERQWPEEHRPVAQGGNELVAEVVPVWRD
ncbi:hypothetical protein STXM2123_391 [Streptomyces sp. F-3]|nr:hypothetical protein STXM2123_391 [Streptomyces sp. F-3]